MRRFIIYTILFLAPFVIAIVLMEHFLRGIPNTHMAKAKAITGELSQIKILILGNSHAANGIDPKYLSKKAYNLAQGAQTLDIDYSLLNKYKDDLSALEYVIVPISYHSLWFKLSELKYYRWMAKYNNIYFDIDIEHNPLKKFLLFDNVIKVKLKNLKQYYWENDLLLPDFKEGFFSAPPATDISVLSESGESKAKDFSVNDLDALYSENLKYLKGIIDIANDKGAKVLFITIPCYPTYIDNLKKQQLSLMHQTMDNLENGKDVFYLDLLEDGRKLSLQDFANGDHLSYLGAQKFTMKLDSIIKDIENQSIATQQAIEN